MTWSVVRLGDLATFLSGGTPKKSMPELWDGPLPWLSSKELVTPRIYDSELHVSEQAVGNGTKLVPENTILFVVRGMSLAKEFRISLAKVPVTFNQDLKALKLNDGIDPVFLFYALFSRRHYIQQLAGEASHGTKKLPTEVVQAVEVKVPDLPTQMKVGSGAASYDDLIENNRRRIQLLEEAARLLYKEWFVHLRFPGHEHVKVIDGVPEGWEGKPVDDLTSFLSRGITPKYDDEAEGVVINQKCIRDRMVSLSLARRQRKQPPPAKLVQWGDVLVNSTGAGTLGRVAQFHDIAENLTVDSHVTIVRPGDGVPPHLFGLHLTNLESYIATMGRGATNQTELSRQTIAEIRLLMPPRDLSSVFEDVVAPIFMQIGILSKQIDTLASARDLLLPRLMNGEIAVETEVQSREEVALSMSVATC